VEQSDLVRRTTQILERLNIPYMFVGSVASSVLGEPRFTLDIDIVIDLKPHQVEELCSHFPEAEQYYVSTAAARDAVVRGGQFNVIHFASGNKIDFMVLRRDAWGRSQMARRQRERIVPDVESYVASREDLVIGKLWYYHDGGSEKHLRDITGIIYASGATIDRDYIRHWVSQLGLTDEWNAVLARLRDAPTDQPPPTTNS
jgi:hypothetical protein